MNAVVVDDRDRVAALVTTILFHAGLFGLFLLLKIVTPIPPYPELQPAAEIGIADLGYDLEGMGDDGSEEESSSAASSEAAPPQESNEELVSEEEGEVIDNPPPNKEKPRTETPTTPTRKPPKITEPTVNRNALFTSSNKPGDGPSDRDSGDGPGDRPGDVGLPGGIKGGEGWSLRGSRGATRGPDLSEKPELTNETWVEVAIVIDREGNVKRTYVSDAATTDSKIQNVALRSVKAMRFVANPNGPPEQVQYVRLSFRPH